jgi:DNA-binding NarL/FixJ family response regulator
MRILLVDDDEGFRTALRHLLTQRDHEVRVDEAADGEEALQRVATRRPDAVLMDLTMPRMNGIEATRRLKVRWPELPVLILTVHDDPVYERTARAAGADAFLLKKTAGTALWPALTPLVGGTSGVGPEVSQAVVEPWLSALRRGIGRLCPREFSLSTFRDRPDWRRLPSPL